MCVRNVVTSCLLIALTMPVSNKVSEAQQSFRPSNQASQAYYEPPTRDEYLRHLRTAYQELSYPGQFHSQPTIQQRASAMLQEQYDSGSHVRFSSEKQVQQFNAATQRHKQTPANPVAFRLQDNAPFGDSQGIDAKPQDNTPKNQFNPFADPPVDTPTQEPVQPQQSSGGFDPFSTREPAAREPAVREPAPSPMPQKQDPFADPPAMQDPVLPDDAQPTPDLDMPRLDSRPTQQRDTEPQDHPKRAVLPDDAQGDSMENFKDPEPIPTLESPRFPSTRPSDTYRSPAGVYRPPAQSSLPPIVQPEQVSPYEMQQLPAPQYAPDTMYPPFASGQQLYTPQAPAPSYQAPYQPMPYREPSMPPMHPVAPSTLGDPGTHGMVQQEYAHPAPSVGAQSPVGSVYHSVVPSESGPRIPGHVCQTNDCSPCVGGNASGCADFYLSLFGGVADIDLTSLTTGRDYFADDGFTLGVALGRRNGRNLRSEIEFTARNNDISAFLSSNPNSLVSGELTAYSGMANAYWEFIDLPTRCFKPYIGVGVGFVSIDSTLGTIGNSLIPSGEDNDTSFAYQVMAGINYKAYRNMDLFAEYRVFEADSYRLETTGNGGRYEYQVDSILFGLRWKF